MVTPVKTSVYVIKSMAANFNLKAITSSFIGIITSLIGYDMMIVKALFVLVIIDWITGATKGIKTKTFTSHKLMRSAYKLIVYFSLLIMSHQALKIAYVPEWIDEVVEAFIAFTEIISILENCAELGFPRLRKIASKINSRFDGYVESL